jgi:hypothetical protein
VATISATSRATDGGRFSVPVTWPRFLVVVRAVVGDVGDVGWSSEPACMAGRVFDDMPVE